MHTINVTISDKSHKHLLDLQAELGHVNQSEAIDELLRMWKKEVK